MKPDRKIIVSIETAIEGGSISIIENREEIDFWKGTKEGSKAEDFLVEISGILDKNKIERKHIKLINVSNGPGTSTGIKIGLAMAKGLGTALNCEVMEVSLLEAISKFINKGVTGNAFIYILSVGNNLFLFEKVDSVNFNILKKLGKTKTFTIEEIIEELKLLSNIHIIIQQKIFETYNNLMSESINKSNQLIVFKENMASVIGKNATLSNASDKAL